MNVFRASILPAIVGACVVASSQAQTTAHASVTNVAWELIDLTPNDGVAPSVSFEVTGNYNFDDARLSLLLRDREPLLTRQHQTTAPLFTAQSGSLSYTDVSSTPATTLSASAATIVSLTAGMSAQVQASSDPDGGTAAGFAESGYIHFILAPNSALRLSADLSASGVLDPASPGSTYAVAHMFYVPNAPAIGNAWYNYKLDSVYYEAGDSPEGIRTRSVERLFSNATAASSVNAFAFNVQAVTETSPVPEPASWGMLAAGVLVIGGGVRRRRRAAASARH